MTEQKRSLFWPLRVIAGATLVAPALLFAYATWGNYQTSQQRSTERIGSALDVIQEHVLKALQTIERTIAETNEVLRGFSDEEIRRDEERFSRRLKQSHEAMPQMQSIWAFDRLGRPLVSSTIYPVPQDLNNADRDYFRAQIEANRTFIGDIVQARVGSLRFFVISGRRTERPDGQFNGVIGITVLPDHFRDFYGRLS
jgi:two-component system, NtrC family, sensor kinase